MSVRCPPHLQIAYAQIPHSPHSSGQPRTHVSTLLANCSGSSLNPCAQVRPHSQLCLTPNPNISRLTHPNPPRAPSLRSLRPASMRCPLDFPISTTRRRCVL
eukprot:scaffold7307_cov48-Phaeocystis_antarctica.AAC.1